MEELSASDMQRMRIVYGYAKRALNEWGERGFPGARQSIPVRQDDTDIAMRDLLAEYAGLLRMLGVMAVEPAAENEELPFPDPPQGNGFSVHVGDVEVRSDFELDESEGE